MAAVVAASVPSIAKKNAASAGLWLSAGIANRVHAPPSGRVGSVGCVVPTLTEARRLKRRIEKAAAAKAAA